MSDMASIPGFRPQVKKTKILPCDAGLTQTSIPRRSEPAPWLFLGQTKAIQGSAARWCGFFEKAIPLRLKNRPGRIARHVTPLQNTRILVLAIRPAKALPTWTDEEPATSLEPQHRAVLPSRFPGGGSMSSADPPGLQNGLFWGLGLGVPLSVSFGAVLFIPQWQTLDQERSVFNCGSRGDVGKLSSFRPWIPPCVHPQKFIPA